MDLRKSKGSNQLHYKKYKRDMDQMLLQSMLSIGQILGIQPITNGGQREGQSRVEGSVVQWYSELREASIPSDNAGYS